jgi:nitroreductase
MTGETLAGENLPEDRVGLLEGLTTTRSIRRYTSEPIPPAALRAMLFAATRAPSGSNRQPFRFVVLNNGPVAAKAKELIGASARHAWAAKRQADGYDKGSGLDSASPKARMARTMQRYVDQFETAPVLILPCMVRYREPHTLEGASIYPAVQNLLLAARGLGYGGVITAFHGRVEAELKSLLGIPEGAFVAATVTLGRPEGSHGPVRRLPLGELVFADAWGAAADWAVDPPGTRHTRGGPPKAAAG